MIRLTLLALVLFAGISEARHRRHSCGQPVSCGQAQVVYSQATCGQAQVVYSQATESQVTESQNQAPVIQAPRFVTSGCAGGICNVRSRR